MLLEADFFKVFYILCPIVYIEIIQYRSRKSNFSGTWRVLKISGSKKILREVYNKLPDSEGQELPRELGKFPDILIKLRTRRKLY